MSAPSPAEHDDLLSRLRIREIVVFCLIALIAVVANLPRELVQDKLGIDEVDAARRHVSWISPIARALLRARAGDRVLLRSPGGIEELEILSVRYETID